MSTRILRAGLTPALVALVVLLGCPGPPSEAPDALSAVSASPPSLAPRPGMRGFLMPVPTDQIRALKLGPGALVDVVGTVRHGGEPRALTLLWGVDVLATAVGEDGSGAVMLELTQHECTLVGFAATQGEFGLHRRGVGDRRNSRAEFLAEGSRGRSDVVERAYREAARSARWIVPDAAAQPWTEPPDRTPLDLVPRSGVGDLEAGLRTVALHLDLPAAAAPLLPTGSTVGIWGVVSAPDVERPLAVRIAWGARVRAAAGTDLLTLSVDVSAADGVLLARSRSEHPLFVALEPDGDSPPHTLEPVGLHTLFPEEKVPEEAKPPKQLITIPPTGQNGGQRRR